MSDAFTPATGRGSSSKKRSQLDCTHNSDASVCPLCKADDDRVFEEMKRRRENLEPTKE